MRESSTDWLPSEGAFYEPSLSTEVEGEVFVDDKLSKEEIAKIRKFAEESAWMRSGDRNVPAQQALLTVDTPPLRE